MRPDETIALIRSYAERFHVWLEFGLQSMHDRTLRTINRGHDWATFRNAVRRIGSGPIRICAHIILGLPGESREEMMETARALAELPIQGIKIHNLLALKGTALGSLYEQGELTLMSRRNTSRLSAISWRFFPRRWSSSG